jgi:hypothetical protein
MPLYVDLSQQLRNKTEEMGKNGMKPYFQQVTHYLNFPDLGPATAKYSYLNNNTIKKSGNYLRYKII